MLTLLLLTAVALSGCVGEGTGTLALYITDAPSELNITEAYVTISNVRVHLITTHWHDVAIEPQEIELISLQNTEILFASINLSEGSYPQMKLQVDSARVVIDGIEYNLTIPSNKINLITPFKIYNNQTTSLLLDFDVHKSIHAAGKKKYIMRPTIKVTQIE